MHHQILNYSSVCVINYFYKSLLLDKSCVMAFSVMFNNVWFDASVPKSKEGGENLEMGHLFWYPQKDRNK